MRKITILFVIVITLIIITGCQIKKNYEHPSNITEEQSTEKYSENNSEIAGNSDDSEESSFPPTTIKNTEDEISDTTIIDYTTLQNSETQSETSSPYTPENNKDNEPTIASSPSPIELNFLSKSIRYSIMAIIENKLFYSTYPDNGDLFVYSYDLVSGETTAYGSIHNFLINSNDYVIFHDNIYFYVVTSKDGYNQTQNLCEINVSAKEINVISSETNHQTFNYLGICQDTLVSTNGYSVSSTIGKTYIELISPVDNTRKTILAFEADKTKREGSAVTNIATYHNKISAFVECYENGTVVPYIYFLNKEGIVEQKINMSQYSNYLFSTAITEMTYVNDYIYFRNMSNMTLFGQIIDGEFVEVFAPTYGRLQIINSNDSDDCVLFYDLETKTISRYDISTKKIYVTEADFIIGSQYIMFSTMSNQYVVYILNDDLSSESVFYVNTKELASYIQ